MEHSKEAKERGKGGKEAGERQREEGQLNFPILIYVPPATQDIAFFPFHPRSFNYFLIFPFHSSSYHSLPFFHTSIPLTFTLVTQFPLTFAP